MNNPVYPFKNYESKPITRQAFQIDSKTTIKKAPEEATYEAHVSIAEGFGGIELGRMIKFKAYEEPKVGDWIVRLTHDDTYHVTDKVFRERNIVPE